MAERLNPDTGAADRAAIRLLEWWRRRALGGATPRLEDFLAEHPAQAPHAERLANEVAGLLDPEAEIRAPALRMRIGRFDVLRELGSGGQGVVYLARDPGLARLVALKVLHPHRLGGEAKERFKREADALARIEDCAIATVYEVDLDAPTPYMAMRYVPGRSLLDLISAARQGRDGPQSSDPTLRPGSSDSDDVRRIVAAGLRCARALERAHAAGVIHRDIKPGNIQISTAGEAVLLDFGLARDDSVSRTDLTHTGERPGTPRYMSPEQLWGSGEVDARTDVWSLGVTLYETLALEHPFRLGSRDGRSTTHLARAIRDRRPRRAGRSNDGVQRDLEWILQCALEQDLDRRYPSAGALADDLERFLSDEPVRARPPSLLYRSRKLVARHRISAAATAIVAVLLLVQQGLHQWRLTTASGRIEGVRAAELRQREAVLDAVQWLSSEIDFERMTEVLEDRGPSGVARAERMLVQLRAMVAEQGAQDASADSDIDQRLLRASLANAERDFELTLTLLGPGARRPRDVPAFDEVERLTLLLLAHAQRETGDDEAALASCERLVELAPERANILVNRGNILADLGRSEEALESYDRAIEMRPESAWAWAQRGQAKFWLSDGTGALTDYGEAVRLAPTNPVYRFNYAVGLGNHGRFEEAIAALDRIAALSPDHAMVYVVRGRNYYNTDLYERALQDFDRAFELSAEPELDWRLGRARTARMLGLHARVLDDLDVYLGQRPASAEALELRGLAHRGLGDVDAALADYDASIAAGPRAGAHNQRGILLGSLSRFEEALADLNRAYELGHRSPTLTYNRAAMLHGLDRNEEALELLAAPEAESFDELREMCRAALDGEG